MYMYICKGFATAEEICEPEYSLFTIWFYFALKIHTRGADDPRREAIEIRKLLFEPKLEPWPLE